MSVQEIQAAIAALPAGELADLLEWIEEYRVNTWDRQVAQGMAQKVRERLVGRMPGGVMLFVVDADVYKIDDWWRVPVRPSRWPKRMFELYEVLAEVEDNLQEREHLNILLATGEPLEEDEEAAATL